MTDGWEDPVGEAQRRIDGLSGSHRLPDAVDEVSEADDPHDVQLYLDGLGRADLEDLHKVVGDWELANRSGTHIIVLGWLDADPPRGGDGE